MRGGKRLKVEDVGWWNTCGAARKFDGGKCGATDFDGGVYGAEDMRGKLKAKER